MAAQANKKRQLIPEKSKKQEIETLKGELRKLKKQVKHLRKDNLRLRGYHNEIYDLIEEKETIPEKKKYSCPECSSINVDKIVLGKRGEYYFCQDCAARGKCE